MKGITLIGMPASGKSTIGRLLADELGWPLYDIDRVMEEKEAMPIAEIIKRNGQEYVKKLEADCVSELALGDVILSPGGSIIYGKSCHGNMKKYTHVVWLDVPLEVIAERLADDPDNERGILGMEDGGLEKLFNERRPLYEELADITILTIHKTPASTSQAILRVIKERES